MTLFRQSSLRTSFLIVSFCLAQKVRGHGYVESPRSRQWRAAEDGVWYGGTDSLPEKEDCPHCSNTKTSNGFCGKSGDRDYDHPKNSFGGPLPPNVQAVYTEGQIIDVIVNYSTNHRGHYMLFGCPDFESPTKSCFQQYPLEFIEDISMENIESSQRGTANAPKDEHYPERGYVDPTAKKTHMRFKLPQGLTGDLVLLQWHWVTGNSCRSAGYDEYPWPTNWEGDNMEACPAYDALSQTGEGFEQFWNCIEIKITPTDDDSTPSPPVSEPSSITTSPVPAPTQSETTLSPVSAPTPSRTTPPVTEPTPSSNGCCSHKFKECDVDWCGSTEASCNACGSGKVWLANGPVQSCVPRYDACTNNINGCCAPARCEGDQWYKQCVF